MSAEGAFHEVQKKQDNLQLNMCAADDMFVDSMYCNKYPLSNHSFKYNLCSYFYFADLWCAVHGQIAKVSESAYMCLFPSLCTLFANAEQRVHCMHIINSNVNRSYCT